jgi:hypothetical protein
VVWEPLGSVAGGEFDTIKRHSSPARRDWKGRFKRIETSPRRSIAHCLRFRASLAPDPHARTTAITLKLALWLLSAACRSAPAETWPPEAWRSFPRAWHRRSSESSAFACGASTYIARATESVVWSSREQGQGRKRLTPVTLATSAALFKLAMLDPR